MNKHWWFYLLVVYVLMDSYHEWKQNKNIMAIVEIQRYQLDRELDRLFEEHGADT